MGPARTYPLLSFGSAAAHLLFLLLVCIAVSPVACAPVSKIEEASQVASQLDEASSAASPDAPSSSSQSTGMGSTQIYYILALSACAAGFIGFVVTLMLRRRRRRRLLADAESLAPESYPAAQPRRRERVVLDDAQFNLLPHIVVEKEAEEEACTICLCEYSEGEELVVLVPCNHRFHSECAHRWLTVKSTACPLCKADMLEGLGVKRPKSVAEDAESDGEPNTAESGQPEEAVPSQAEAGGNGESNSGSRAAVNGQPEEAVLSRTEAGEYLLSPPPPALVRETSTGMRRV
ncbi:hypothetical protein GGI25_003324 [Coemansia spiralis]|uniref:RING-type domain-containing protein n=2 Tax=Coemansia TaxID=4863 RepID=A0A9W8G293_9FUNG|nr:hypothetical protein BX070DRAFT_222108 [Coemansia spiralis]KAJ1992788.1 hypothetical protein EDC05_002572 [Coemansia umbellata]KAJ2622555.1 hypothetical protein GGI26_003154 [Coemansia sp. RSA 1358]KAJ2677104.1 hypothetical protein GGI25_003324 [Coemansia spiralis]